MMTDQQKLDFVHKQTKLALAHLQHFDEGGTALGGPTAAGTQNAVNPNQGLAGTIGGILGINNDFKATGADIQKGTNAAQLNQAYTGAQGALGKSQNLTNTLTPGVAQGANTQSTLTGQLQNQAAAGSNLAQQLQAESMGGGPNPAQAALNQNTGRNIQQQAALAAGTRGAGANAGLIAMNAGNQGANIQQQAVGQGAVGQAQQQLAAQNQLQNLTLGSQSQLGNVAAQQVGQGQNAVQLENQTQQGEQNILQGANTAANNAAVSQQQNINATNAAVAAGNSNTNQGIISGLGSAIGKIGSSIAGGMGAHGGLVGYAQGGKALDSSGNVIDPNKYGGGPTPQAETVGKKINYPGSAHGGMVMPPHLNEMAKIYHPHLASGGEVQPWQQLGNDPGSINGGGPVNLPTYQGPALAAALDKGGGPAMPKPPGMGGGADAADPSASSGSDMFEAMGADPMALAMLARGGNVKSQMKQGGKVPGKAPPRDAYKNDTVTAKLTPGEVVIDINTLKDKGKLGQMARFVAQEIERKKSGRKLI